MTIRNETTIDHTTTASRPAQDHRIRNAALGVGRFILHLLEMLLAMMVGMPILYGLRNLIPASSRYAAAFVSGTTLNALAMGVFMTVPMVAWMIVRGHGWRHSAEMAFAMFAPVAAIIVLLLLGADASLPWLAKASHPAMPLAMIIAMLYRHDHYTGKSGHAAHAAHVVSAHETGY
jgi:hypothetical protein